MNNSNLISSLDMIIIFISFFGAIILVTFLKKIYYFFIKKKQYFVIPRTSIKGISTIAMTMSLCVVILILISVMTSNVSSILFRAFPGTRITIEGILIKIGGLLFGPFLGLFIGGITDLLAIAMTAGIFHYGYFIAALSYGLIGGLVNTLLNYCSKKQLKLVIFSSLSMLLTALLISLYILLSFPIDQYLEVNFIFQIKFFPWHVVVFIGALTVFAILVINFFYFFSKTKKGRWFGNNLIGLSAVLTLVFLTELFVNVFMLPVFDKDLSTLSYTQWVAIRSLLFVPLVILNLAIIWPIFKIIRPLVKYNYIDDVVGKNNNNYFVRKRYI